jgi:hypothetical protein
MPERDNDDEFQLDFSYFKWQDIPRDVRRQMVLDRSWAARTWINGKTTVQMDVPFSAVRELYNKNWDGCRSTESNLPSPETSRSNASHSIFADQDYGLVFGSIHDGGESPDQREAEKPAQHTEMPSAVDPEELLESFCRVDPREQARRDRFTRAQQKRYEGWLN